jgi:hypothetical protein
MASVVCRRLAEDSNLRARHQPLYALLDGMHGRVLLPKPSAEAIRSARAMLREAGAPYSPIHSLLKVWPCNGPCVQHMVRLFHMYLPGCCTSCVPCLDPDTRCSHIQGRDGAEVVRTMCIMHDLLVAPSAQRAQQPPSQPSPASSQQLAYGT